ncbi:hypothetical protein PR202_gb10825 [Eleusine coracana subsp. coracana]|uniref:Uncharacterized protein n=1 Tax=Eleusine coracana subsp. coracana TaxID=191504 RepID=A0AAV5ELG1_ELECO|nr:hypothetical protein QOZ80_3BG0259830 [Eleusine coracana subsp. coracana]GJN23198.1 hypothetical protein PR202_gb10825 [Eleusine coracana subsp. coracana]
MASVVGVWLGEFAKFGRPEAAAHQTAGAEAGRNRQGQDGIIAAVETVKKAVVVHQEKPMRASAILSDPEAVVCLLMDRFAPA